jgi:ankyrin repeat protein
MKIILTQHCKIVCLILSLISIAIVCFCENSTSTQLHVAADGNTVDAIIFLIAAGANVEAKNNYGKTLLDIY